MKITLTKDNTVIGRYINKSTTQFVLVQRGYAKQRAEQILNSIGKNDIVEIEVE